MEPIIIKSLGKKYFFHPGEIVVMNKDKVLRIVHHDEIKEITYNPKFGFKDLLEMIVSPFSYYCGKNAFAIVLISEERPSNKNIICIPLTNAEFEKVKNTFKIPIKLI